MKARTLCLIMMIMVFGLANMAIAEQYLVLPSTPIQNLYQEILSAQSFSNLAAQGGATQSYSSGDKVRFQPILTNINIAPGNVKYYAGYTEGDKIYLAQKGPDGNIIFKALGKETEIPYYDTDYFYGGTWTPDAYFELLGDSFAISGRTFIFGIAPSSVKSFQDFTEKFYGQWISLTKGSTVTPSDNGTTTEPGTGTSSTTNKPTDQMLCFLGGGQWMADMKCVGGQTVSSEKYCTLIGGKWENNQCTNSANSREPLFCAFSGGSWNSTTNTCATTPGKPYYTPSTPAPTQSTPASACQTAGGLWVNNQCLMPGSDTDKIICVSTGGTWANNKCEKSPSLCAANGGTWDIATSTCYTAAQTCAATGGVWQDNQCYTQIEWCTMSGGLWLPIPSDATSRCVSQAEYNCISPNIWVNNSCVTPAAGCSITGGVLVNNVCYLTAEAACTGISGTWDAATSKCYSSADQAACTAPNIWGIDPNNPTGGYTCLTPDLLCLAPNIWNATLNKCLTAQQDCIANSKFWVGNACYDTMDIYCTSINRTYDAATNACK